MARLRFRVTTVHLDEDEEVEAINAVVRDDALAAVERLVGAVRRVGEPRRGGTELTVHLDAGEVGKLFHAAGRVSGLHPDHEHTDEIYDSLSFVVYRMMEND